MKKCFVIMPFEEKLNQYYSKLIKPAVEEMKFTVTRADEIYGIQPIIEDITSQIKSADILIADVTGKNPNVNYELGYAHALNKNVIIISQTMDDIPFDYRHRRAIIYKIDELDWQNILTSTLKKTLAVLEKKIHNTNNEVFGSKKDSYEISYGDLPSKAVLKCSGMFIRLSARAGEIYQYMIDAVLEIVNDIKKIPLELDEILTLRGAWFDDKNGNIDFYIDYLYDSSRKPTYDDDLIKQTFHDGFSYYQSQGTFIIPKCIEARFSSDGFFVNADQYYSRIS